MPEISTTHLLWIALITLGAVISASMLFLASRLKRQRAELAQAEKRIETLNTNISALCAGAVGVDKRIAYLEQSGRDLKHRQESMETRDSGGHAYSDAIRRVRQGASAPRLVEELNLSPGEAELIVMLHSIKEAG